MAGSILFLLIESFLTSSANLHVSITSANYFLKEFHFIVKIPEFEIWKDKPRRL